MNVITAKVEAQPGHKRGLLARFVGAETDLQARKGSWGYVFTAPWILGLVIFVLGPIIASLVLGFTQYDVLSPAKWVGLENYRTALFDDVLFWPALGKTLYYSIGTVPLGLAGSLLLAIMLNQGIHGVNIFRTLFFLPHLTPAVAMAILWLWLMNPEIGPLNYVLGIVGLPPCPWLTSEKTVIPSLILISLWSGMGGNSMLIFLAGLQSVPRELYDAAAIDGATSFHRFRYVTLPMISPTLLFNLVLGVIGALQVFTLAFVATAGGPSYGSWFLALHIYKQAFEFFRMGYASALAWLFVLVLLVFTAVNIRLSDRWVYYAGA